MGEHFLYYKENRHLKALVEKRQQRMYNADFIAAYMSHQLFKINEMRCIKLPF